MWVAQRLTPEEHDIGLSGGQDLFGLEGFGDQPNCRCRHAGSFPDSGGEGDLVAGPDRNRGGHVRARGYIDEVCAMRAQPLHDLHCVIEGEPTIGPVRGRQPHQHGHVLTDLCPDGIDGIKHDACPVLRGATVAVGALVA